MEGGKDFSQETMLFTAGKILGSLTGIVIFSLLLSFVLNKLIFNKSTFIAVLVTAVILHIVVRGMVKRKWL